MSVTPSTLTVLTDGLTFAINVGGVSLFTDPALSSPVTFPQTISSDTTWYAANLTKPGLRQISVNVTTPAGTTILIKTVTALPASVDAAEGTVSYGVGAPVISDPFAQGIIGNVVPVSPAIAAVAANANRMSYYRAVGSATISNLELHVAVSSGNICIAALTGPAGKSNPTAVLVSSGSVACPAIGFASVALGATVTLTQPTGWLSFGVDNVTASFLCAAGAGGSSAVSSLALGQEAGDGTYPQASPPSGLVARYVGFTPILRGA